MLLLDSLVLNVLIIDGAALIYTSVKRNINIDLLLAYLEHILFGLEFHHKPQLLQKDSIFVPIGWDSLQKIEIDFQNQKLCTDPNIDFREVIRVPSTYQKQKVNTFLKHHNREKRESESEREERE
jgi:hypothetical protein